MVDHVEDSVMYAVNEFCFYEKENCFVKILKIMQIDKKNYGEVGIFPALKDFETGLWCGERKHIDQKIVKLESLSRPMVIAIEEEKVWFVGHEKNEEFDWFEGHIKI